VTMSHAALPPNMHEPIIEVQHTDLERSGDSPYRSKCPKCEKGLLMIFRDNRQRLMRHDRCISCAQRFYYTDETINDEALIDVTKPVDVTRRPSSPS
jgi:hypothetical protein